jgi:hypothetical protein
LAAALFVATVALFQVGWFAEVFGAPDPLETAWRDWIQFHRTALRFVSGQADEIYPVAFLDDGRPEFSDGFFFLYPPWVIWVTLPLSLLSRMAAYLACAGVAGLGVLLASWGMLRGLGVRGGQCRLFLLGTMASAPWNGAVILGHLSALLILSPALAVLAWARRRPFLTGCALSLLLTKPNWGLPLLAFLLVGGRWREVGGFLLGGALLFLVSLPLGPGLWMEWLQTMAGYRALALDATPPWKQGTLFASLQSLLQRPGSDPVVSISWVLLALGGLGWTCLAWAKGGGGSGRFPRLLGVSLLALLVFNPYAYFYDILLVTPMALVLWTQPTSYGSQRLRRGARVACLVTYSWLFFQYLLLMESAPSLAGIGFSVWLLFELADLRPISVSRQQKPKKSIDLLEP